MKLTTSSRCLLALVILFAFTSLAQNKKASSQTPNTTTLFGRNLLKNPGAADEVEPGHVKEWQGDSVSTSTYGHTSGEWDWNVEGAPKGGCCYFRLAWEGELAQKEMSQTVDLSAGAEQIDEGGVTAKASSYLGSMVGGNTSVKLTVTFLDGNDQQLATIEGEVIKPDTLPQPSVGSAAMVPSEASGEVPKGARKALFKLTATSKAEPGGDYAAFADNLSLVLIHPKKD